jgi:hypothetical protein
MTLSMVGIIFTAFRFARYFRIWRWQKKYDLSSMALNLLQAQKCEYFERILVFIVCMGTRPTCVQRHRRGLSAK